MSNETVNWSVFDITPFGDKDVTKAQAIAEYKKFNGTPREFVEELAQRFEYSGAMCELVEQWCSTAEAK